MTVATLILTKKFNAGSHAYFKKMQAVCRYSIWRICLVVPPNRLCTYFSSKAKNSNKENHSNKNSTSLVCAYYKEASD